MLCSEAYWQCLWLFQYLVMLVVIIDFYGEFSIQHFHEVNLCIMSQSNMLGGGASISATTVHTLQESHCIFLSEGDKLYVLHWSFNIAGMDEQTSSTNGSVNSGNPNKLHKTKIKIKLTKQQQYWLWWWRLSSSSSRSNHSIGLRKMEIF
jgi:hypothetical protein